jgi:RimJ/RimL family protein N-acetyltransferase
LSRRRFADWQAFVEGVTAGVDGDLTVGIETEAGELIGYARLKGIRKQDRSADFGIAIKRESWSRGYGRDATRTLLRHAFIAMKLHRVSLTVVEYNERALRMYEAVGFRVEGRMREARLRDGRYWDNIVMGVLESEFRET